MKTMLIVGDSFVEGVGGVDTQGWAHALAALLPDLDITISGEGGDNTRKLIERWPPGTFDMVVIQVGTNDSRFRPSLKGYEIPPDRFRKNLAELSRLAKHCNKGAHVIFVGLFFVDEGRTVPYKEDKIYQNVSLAQYDEMIREFAKQHRLMFVPLRDIPQDASYLADGLHPSPKGHNLIFERVARAVDAVLQRL